MDHYQTLGVERNSSSDEIKKAYRKLASKHHPDKGGDTATFQKIEEAYRILSDPAQREQYDNPQTQNPFHGFDFQRHGFGGFEQFFTNAARQSRQRNYSCVVFVTLEAVALGSKETVYLNTDGGAKMFQIDVPKGVEDGQLYNYDKIMPDGLLQVQFRIHKHKQFDRRGLDLYSNCTVSVFDLILGTTISVTTIYGKTLEVNVPARTNPGTSLRLSKYGLDTPAGTGDHYVLIFTKIPDIISDELLVALEQERIKNS